MKSLQQGPGESIPDSPNRCVVEALDWDEMVEVIQMAGIRKS
jgi:hypothetical protein